MQEVQVPQFLSRRGWLMQLLDFTLGWSTEWIYVVHGPYTFSDRIETWEAPGPQSRTAIAILHHLSSGPGESFSMWLQNEY